LTDALQSIVSDPNVDRDLTARYYAQKILRFVRCHFLTEKWIDFKQKPIEQQSYNEGLVLNFFN
jgi:hypothetical protein